MKAGAGSHLCEEVRRKARQTELFFRLHVQMLGPAMIGAILEGHQGPLPGATARLPRGLLTAKRGEARRPAARNEGNGLWRHRTGCARLSHSVG